MHVWGPLAAAACGKIQPCSTAYAQVHLWQAKGLASLPHFTLSAPPMSQVKGRWVLKDFEAEDGTNEVRPFRGQVKSRFKDDGRCGCNVC